jgi:hypothetical protein
MLAMGSAEGNGLRVRVTKAGWSILLRRRDFAPEARFAEFYGKPVEPSALLRFLPMWEKLSWARVPEHLISAAECSAADGEFYVSIQADTGSGRSHEDVIEAFSAFMRRAPT